MEGFPGMDPFSGLFNAITASLSARSFAAAAASMQSHHFEQLRAEGMEVEQALELTARTSVALFTALTEVLEAIAKNGKTIAEGIDIILAAAERYEEGK